MGIGCGGSDSSTSSGNTNTGSGGSGSAAPQILRVEPSRVMVGDSEGLVTAAGTNFTAGSTVLFDGAPAATFYQNGSTLQFEVPDQDFDIAQTHTIQISDSTLVSNMLPYEVYAPQPGPDVLIGQQTQYMSENLLSGSLVPDINGDGRADLIMLNAPEGSSPTLVTRYGQANGLFSADQPLGSFSLQITPSIVLAGDFNGDGHPDLLLLGQGAYQVLLNDGTGQFASGGSQPLPSWCYATAAVGDFNRDGKLDFACGGNGGTEPFLLLFGNGEGSFSAPVPAGTPGANPFLAVAGDFDHDGYIDLAYLNVVYGSQDQLHLLPSSGNGSYIDTVPTGVPGVVLAFAVADFNNDRTLDIFAIDSSGMGRAYLAGC
jgi:hypothetical protein